jgi:hypothetical protein
MIILLMMFQFEATPIRFIREDAVALLVAQSRQGIDEDIVKDDVSSLRYAEREGLPEKLQSFGDIQS